MCFFCSQYGSKTGPHGQWCQHICRKIWQTGSVWSSHHTFQITWFQWLFYTWLVWGELLALGRDIGGLGAVPPAGPGAEPLVRGLGAKPPEAESFLFHNIFLRHALRSNALTDFDTWWLKMRGITQGCAFLGLKYLMWCWLLAGKRLLKLLKLNNSFTVSFL